MGRRSLCAFLTALLLVIVGGTVFPVQAEAYDPPNPVGPELDTSPSNPGPTTPGQWSCDTAGDCQYLDSEGTPYYNLWVSYNGKWYYIDGTGWMVRGRENMGGVCPRRYIAWKEYGFDLSGAMITGWHKSSCLAVNGGDLYWEYYDSTGKLVWHGVHLIDGKQYLFHYGKLVIGDMREFSDGGKTYRVTTSGVLHTGWYGTTADDGSTVWFYHDADGVMVVDEWRWINGHWYYFGSTGIMYAGDGGAKDFQIGGDWYQFTPSGEMITGWYKGALEDGTSVWLYYGPDGKNVYTTGQYSNGKWYYFDSETGYMLTDRMDGVRLWGYTVRITASGAAHIGWYYDGSSWYYHKSDGKMAAGEWVYTGGKWYFFGFNGKMIANGCFNDSSGDGNVYCADKTGAMVTNNWFLDPYHEWRYLGSSGVAQNGWQLIGGKWYYFTPNRLYGMVTGTYLIGQTYYVFDSSGAWTGQVFSSGSGIEWPPPPL
ncbi:MAG: hypothetical protein WBH82_05455 [Arcanobacterium sp.]